MSSKADDAPKAPGYIRLGRRYIQKSFILTAMAAAFAAGIFYMTVLHPTIVNYYLRSKELPKLSIDSPYLCDYTGRAQLLLPDGTLIYEGRVEGAAAEGEGKLYSSGVLLYEGQFSENRYNGKGTLYYPDGELWYTGEFLDNLYHGNGRLEERQEDALYIYIGEFESGFPQGIGKLYGPDKRLIYHGAFSEGYYDGQGRLYGEDGGLIYDGNFAEGQIEGKGRLYSGGVLIYEGEFIAGQYSGEGVEYNAQTGFPVFAGKYLDGERMEAGVEYTQGGAPLPAAPHNPIALLGLDYNEVRAALAESGIVCSEQALHTRLMLTDEQSGVLYAFALDFEGKPEYLAETYLCGLSVAGGIVVGTDIEDITLPYTGGEMIGTPEMLALGVSNTIWSGETPAAVLQSRIFSAEKLTVAAFYEPLPAVEPESEESKQIPLPGGRILFLKVYLPVENELIS